MSKRTEEEKGRKRKTGLRGSNITFNLIGKLDVIKISNLKAGKGRYTHETGL